MKSKLVTPYAASLLQQGIKEVSDWLKVSSDDELDIVDSLLKAAISAAEARTNSAILSATYECYFDDFGSCAVPYPSDCGSSLKLWPANVSAVATVKYTATDGTVTTLANTVYALDAVTQPAEIVLKYAQLWPVTQGTRNNVVINFQAGYASWSAIPDMLKTAIKMVVGHWYENRQDVVVGHTANEVPQTSKMLFDHYRIKLL